jgi:glycosyltransferase involved in cell wall biosynthesis
MISIVTPTLNEEVYLPRLLKSIESQDYQDFEIIVADNNSSDGTRDIALSFLARVVDGGLPSVARNRGADIAKGEYILFLDADTILPPYFLHKLIQRVEEDSVDICIPALQPIDGTKPVYKLIFKLSNSYFKLMEGVKPQGGGACIFVSKRLHNKIGGFDESRRRSEDLDYINKAAKIGRFRCYLDLYVDFSLRRFETEGIATCLQKYFRSAIIFNFTGKPDEKKDYEYGMFSKCVISASKIKASNAGNTM